LHAKSMATTSDHPLVFALPSPDRDTGRSPSAGRQRVRSASGTAFHVNDWLTSPGPAATPK
jgi:hypothetical protein